ncbi:MAG: AMP-binding protein [Frankiales bacterium]|nr:AMP-binding protein [Frankiales bacterium]
MHEIHEPPLVPEPVAARLTDDVVRHATTTPERVVLSRRAEGVWRDVTARDFHAEVRATAKGLVAAGVGPGDRVGLMSRTRYEWTVVDYAIWYAGGVTVPIYETSSAEQVEWILGDSGAVLAVVEADRHHALVDEAAERLPALRRTVVVEHGGLDSLAAEGAHVDDDELEARRTGVGPHDLATIIYTSGTTGRPKGCELTHENFAYEAENVVASVPEIFTDPECSTLLFLPLAHVFGRIIQIACVSSGVRLAHTPDVSNLLEDLAEFRPTFLLAVPRVFEKVFNGARQRAIADGRGAIFHRAAAVAVAWSEGLDRGGAGLGVRLQHALFDRLVYARLRTAMGGRVRWAVSGGAPLGARLGHFFRGTGLVVLEGYGLTETAGATTVNRPRLLRIGSVGRPFPGASVRIADDGEVLLSGRHVFRGYWANPQATAEAIDADGWFHSGDLGALDDDGYLSITGRKKEILVTAGGKNVAPAVLEDRLRSHWIVGQCMVVGDARPYVAALVTIDPESFPVWRSEHGKDPAAEVADLAEDPDLRATVQHAVDDANRAVSQAESIRRFRIVPGDWTEEGGQLTPSMKLKRDVVMKELAGEVESLYS